jgi:hypothetical protein
MSVKLLLQWDIRPGFDSQYPEFIMREFAPTVTRMGLQIVEVWYTLYGEVPQILIAGVAPNERKLRQILASEEWQDLNDRLMTFVQNFQKKVVPDRERFQF